MKKSIALIVLLTGAQITAWAGPLDGTWINKDPDTRGITRFEISTIPGGKAQFTCWGRAHPDDIRRGPMDMILSGDSIRDTPNKYGFARDEAGFADSIFFVRPAGEDAVLQHLTVFKDDSGRANYFTEDTFKRRSSPSASQADMAPAANMIEMAGSRFIDESGGKVKAAPAAKITGFYFSAHWCPPCRAFTPKLVEFYSGLKKEGGDLEIVFVSHDKGKSEMMDYMKETKMPWLAVPYDSDAAKALQRFVRTELNIQGIPALVIVKDGRVITTKGREDVQSLGSKAYQKWLTMEPEIYGSADAVRANASAAAGPEASSDAISAGDYTCRIRSSTMTITRYTGAGKNVVIPDAINGLPVTVIGAEAFYENKTIARVTIPDSVTNIEDKAFGFCRNLASVTIPSSVTRIGDQAFLWCMRLPGITIPGSVTEIGDGAFHGCSGMTTITVDTANPVYSSLDGVLFNKNQTELIKCPSGRAGDYTVPGSVSRIGESAFFVTDLTTITIPASVADIGSYALSDGHGRSLTAIMVDANNPVFSSVDGVLFNKDRTMLVQCPGKRMGSYAVPAGVTCIGDGAFYYCSNLTDVIIPDSVTRIGQTAFGFCRELNRITFPNSVTNIGNSAFLSCGGLTELYFHGNAPDIGSDLFRGYKNVTVYYLPGTTGWESTFGGRPTVLWTPVSPSQEKAK